jgi:O-antigen/teichoic acid export membrane protein
VYLLYGADYLGAQIPLIIVVWYTGISAIGNLTQVYLAIHGLNKYINYFAVAGLVTDVVLNLLLIPVWGGAGAAVATLVTYIVINIVSPLVFRETRPAGKVLVQALAFQNVAKPQMIRELLHKIRQK